MALKRKIQIRRGAAASRPTLAAGEFGLDTDAGSEAVYIGTVSSGNMAVSSSSSVTTNFRCKAVSLLAATSTPVSYSSSISGTVNLVVLRCYDSSGADVEVTISSVTSSGFTAISPVAATLVYMAVKEI